MLTLFTLTIRLRYRNLKLSSLSVWIMDQKVDEINFNLPGERINSKVSFGAVCCQYKMFSEYIGTQKPSLLRKQLSELLYPIYVHIILFLWQQNGKAGNLCAKSFLKKFHHYHITAKPQEIEILRTFQTFQIVVNHPYFKLYRKSSRIGVKFTESNYSRLQIWLKVNQPLLISKLLKENFRPEILKERLGKIYPSFHPPVIENKQDEDCILDKLITKCKPMTENNHIECSQSTDACSISATTSNCTKNSLPSPQKDHDKSPTDESSDVTDSLKTSTKADTCSEITLGTILPECTKISLASPQKVHEGYPAGESICMNGNSIPCMETSANDSAYASSEIISGASPPVCIKNSFTSPQKDHKSSSAEEQIDVNGCSFPSMENSTNDADCEYSPPNELKDVNVSLYSSMKISCTNGSCEEKNCIDSLFPFSQSRSNGVTESKCLEEIQLSPESLHSGSQYYTEDDATQSSGSYYTRSEADCSSCGGFDDVQTGNNCSSSQLSNKGTTDIKVNGTSDEETGFSIKNGKVLIEYCDNYVLNDCQSEKKSNECSADVVDHKYPFLLDSHRISNGNTKKTFGINQENKKRNYDLLENDLECEGLPSKQTRMDQEVPILNGFLPPENSGSLSDTTSDCGKDSVCSLNEGNCSSLDDNISSIEENVKSLSSLSSSPNDLLPKAKIVCNSLSSPIDSNSNDDKLSSTDQPHTVKDILPTADDKISSTDQPHTVKDILPSADKISSTDQPHTVKHSLTTADCQFCELSRRPPIIATHIHRKRGRSFPRSFTVLGKKVIALGGCACCAILKNAFPALPFGQLKEKENKKTVLDDMIRRIFKGIAIIFSAARTAPIEVYLAPKVVRLPSNTSKKESRGYELDGILQKFKRQSSESALSLSEVPPIRILNIEGDRELCSVITKDLSYVACGFEDSMYMWPSEKAPKNCLVRLSSGSLERCKENTFAPRRQRVRGVVISEGHCPGPAYCLACNPVTNTFVSGSKSGIVRSWSPTEKKCLSTYKCHTAPVYNICFKPNSTDFVTASEDKRAIVWDYENATPKGIYNHNNPVKFASFHPECPYLVTATSRTLHLWSEYGHNPQKVCDNAHQADITSIAFSPSGDHLASADASGLVNIWDMNKPQLRYSFLVTQRGVKSICYNSSSKENILATASYDNVLRLYSDTSWRRDTLPKTPLFTTKCLNSSILHNIQFSNNDELVEIIYTKRKSPTQYSEPVS